MKTKKILIPFLSLVLFFSTSVKAQDSIMKINGELILAKVLEVGTNAISFKKSTNETGPTYTEEKANIAFIRLKNDQREYFTKKPIPDSPNLQMTPIPTLPNTPALTNTPAVADNNPLKNGPVSNQYRIEHLDKKYTINSQKVSSKAVDKLLAKSTNPMVRTISKTAKTFKTFQKIIGLTSYPSTIAGGIASISTFNDVYKQIKAGGASTSSYLNAGMSFLGTLTFPTVSKLLKNKRDKLYDKAIDLYNIQN